MQWKRGHGCPAFQSRALRYCVGSALIDSASGKSRLADRPHCSAIWSTPRDVGSNWVTATGPSCARWSAGRPPALGGRGDLHRARRGIARYRDRQHRAARHRRGSARQPRRCRSGSSTSIRSRWWRPCCRSARSAKSSVTSGSISADWLLFTLASLASACAWSLESLLVARTLQGLGASGLMSVNAALVRFVYPSRLLGRGFGYNALTVAIAITLGPTVAAGILALGPWPWLFAVNIPIGLIAIAIGLKTLPRHAAGRSPRSIFSAPLMAAGCARPHHHRDQRRGASCRRRHWSLIALVVADRARMAPDPPARRSSGADASRRPVPAADCSRCRRPPPVCSFAVQGLAFVALPFYFQETLQRTAVETGLFMTPWPLVVAIMAPIAGPPVGPLPGRACSAASASRCSAVGMGLLATLPAAPATADIVWRMAAVRMPDSVSSRRRICRR